MLASEKQVAARLRPVARLHGFRSRAAKTTTSRRCSRARRRLSIARFTRPSRDLPLRPLLAPVVGDLIPGDFTPGSEYTLLELVDPAVRIGALVCFEDTLGDLTRRFVARGAQLLVNVTNDGWFAQSPAAAQHLANSLFRAVETRRPLVRCGNTGLTGSIDPFGRAARLDASSRFPAPRQVILSSSRFSKGFVSGESPIPTGNRTTFYTPAATGFRSGAPVSRCLCASARGCANAAECSCRRRGSILPNNALGDQTSSRWQLRRVGNGQRNAHAPSPMP